ncbi:MAG: proteasome subunit beta, partial [Actinomycetota bacterium]|nr:proteasome subunit beta [Actinomycetota bacterium]
MPMFLPNDDPGANFPALLRRTGLTETGPGGERLDGSIPHATTCVAVRFADGVIMAGDRR